MSALEPFTYPIDAALRFSGLGRTRLYELIGAGKIEARKSGRRTLVVGESLRKYLLALPPAEIRSGQKRAA